MYIVSWRAMIFVEVPMTIAWAYLYTGLIEKAAHNPFSSDHVGHRQ
jgi:hypothetical protein